MVLDIKDIFTRLLLSLIVGGIVGYERERKNRAAGLRTHILVCLGATIISLLQIDIANKAIAMASANNELSEVIKVDYSRLGAQVITGVGFIGAGAIIRTKGNIKGLTTAATLWVVSCLGLAIGMGEYYISVLGVIIIVIVLVFLKIIEDKFISKNILKKLEVRYYEMDSVGLEIQEVFKNSGLKVILIEYIIINESIINKEIKSIYTILSPEYISLEKIIEKFKDNLYILDIKIL